MKQKIIVFLMILMAFTPVEGQIEPDFDNHFIDAQYAFWFAGNTAKAKNLLENANPGMPHVAWLSATIEQAEGNQDSAIQSLLMGMNSASDVEAQAIYQRLVSLDRLFALPYRQNDEYWVGITTVHDIKSRGFSIKEGLLFQPMERESEPGVAVSYKLHTVKNKGKILNDFGFSKGDNILSINGKPAVEWNIDLLHDFADSLREGVDVTVSLVPAGQQNVVQRIYHICPDREVLAMHLKSRNTK